MGDNKLCRFCYSSECDDLTGPFISPCKCDGSIKWVHRNCLDSWRIQSANYSDMTQCYLCKTHYQMIPCKYKDNVSTLKKLMKILYRLLLLPKRAAVVIMLFFGGLSVVLVAIGTTIMLSPLVLVEYLLGGYDDEFNKRDSNYSSAYKRKFVGQYKVVDYQPVL